VPNCLSQLIWVCPAACNLLISLRGISDQIDFSSSERGPRLKTELEQRVEYSRPIKCLRSYRAILPVLWRDPNLRLPTAGGLYTWELEKAGRALRVRVEGQFAFNNVPMILRAATAGFGLACVLVLEDQAKALVTNGSLVRVLEGWCPPFAGYHLYYPSRRQPSAAFALLVDALHFRGASKA
jgi:DNA-binding transcriptional LysR family regulator